MYRLLSALLIVGCLVIPIAAQEDDAHTDHDADMIRNVHEAGPQDPDDYLDPSFDAYVDSYYSPCRGGTEAVIFSWHGVNRDDQPPFDPDRQAIHFYCQDRDLYAPTDAVVWGTTMRFGGLIFLEDRDNNACAIFLGMEFIDEALEQNTVVSTGDYLGKYLHKVHVAVIEGGCVDANWYDPAARELEVPVAYVEMGAVLRNDLRESAAVPFISENPSGELADTTDAVQD
ncbi:MAG: hypothetical protein AAF125_08640 [Chloroflexota bacterium]